MLIRGKIFILGNGSNVLFDDEIYQGTVIKLGKVFQILLYLIKKQSLLEQLFLKKKFQNLQKIIIFQD